MKPHFARFAKQQEDLNAASLRRMLEPNLVAQGAEIVIDGARLINFCSNDYLGLCNHPVLRAAAIEGVAKYGVGAGAAPLLSGHSEPHQKLATRLAQLLCRESALLFSSGYLANLGVLTGLTERHDSVFLDRLDHASIIDGARLSGANFQRFRHGDVAGLATLLANVERGCKWIVTDGVFSMDGDLAALPVLSQLADAHEALLICDDAHGFGVIGEGLGTSAYYKLARAEVPIIIVTFGKALGTCGAAVVGPALVIENLLQFARPFIYDTALPPAWAVATDAALDLAILDSKLRGRLFANMRQFQAGLRALDLPVLSDHTPIQPLLIGDAKAALQIAAKLREQGLYVRAVRPPTVPAGTARLRICLSAAHSTAHIARLLDALHTLRPLILN